MFGYSLSRQEERAILEMMGRVATADREVTAREKQYVVEVSHDFDVSAEGIFALPKEVDLASIGDKFSDDTAKMIALVYTIRLAFVDGLYDSDEWLGVRHLGDVLNIRDGTVADLEDWIRRGLEWEEEGRALMNRPSKWPVSPAKPHG
jgi:hypothetical protein